MQKFDSYRQSTPHNFFFVIVLLSIENIIVLNSLFYVTIHPNKCKVKYITKNMHEIMSEEILACGGSSSRTDGFRLWLRQDSNKDTSASAFCSIELVSLTMENRNSIMNAWNF